jgi:predicted RNA methylase
MDTNTNTKLINNINQLLHNKGIKQEERFELLIKLLENNKNNVIDSKYQDILSIINAIDYDNKDLIQEIFMLLGSKLTKYKLDQFYTPLTISKFINSLMINDTNKRAIDPAGGTGDLLLYYNGSKTIWDIDSNALQLCKFNYELNKKDNYSLVCKNSLADFKSEEGTYDYVTMNPPFGSSTIITDNAILDNFAMGKGKKKQEIGILFLELGLKLLKNDGILFAIIPAGYVGNCNKTCLELRQLLLNNLTIASIELPKNTFKRSGTGVNTYLLIVKKREMSKPYNIFITGIENIGYNLTKKETPLKYKIIRETGKLLKDEHNKPILDNDLEDCYLKLSSYCSENKITNTNTNTISISNKTIEYEFVKSCDLINTILDVKRYCKEYLLLVKKLSIRNAINVNKIAKILNSTTKIDDMKKYKYIDISEITSPFYSFKDLYGWELPSRAKYTLQKYDILVSKLEGTMSYCVILDDCDNYISTNGVAVLRANNMNSLYVLLNNIMQKDFVIQHTAYLTGSIMASLSDKDIGEFLIDDKNIDIESTKRILETLEQLHKLRMQ